MKIKHILSAIAIGVVFFISSCKMYYIPVESFKQQFAVWDTSKFKQVKTQGPMGDVVKYKTYPIDAVKCVDKDGNPVLLKNSPALEIRFTDVNNKRTTFYFDRIFVKGDSIQGSQSRFFFVIKTIPLSTVKLIEIQDSRKKLKYVD
ncbi:hypothetical protein [Mucilaginibacter paludis]|uniref:Lipoprotein n=1 Tax=Mucilaginibacter paludis DSM 18603 TaxID=714943 RepID=H1Y8B5_9SPHI|nr:hypothetical protein [Mucilaginibacter paludis]EHQ24934.1 hypothetical protein Mucpa_0753 [Mucilaginibacter paludis DSM 18603]